MIDKYITNNFRYEEMASRGQLPERRQEIFTFAQMAQELRDWAAATFPHHARNGLIVNSWYRTPEHNKAVGGSSNSAHLDARAMDIGRMQPETYKEFVAAWHVICLKYQKIGGINLYKSYIHITDHEDKFGKRNFTVRDLR